MGKGTLVALLAGTVVVAGALWGAILALGLEPRLGLDLQGGVSANLIPAEGQEVDEEILDQTVATIRERVDALGVAEPDIARQGETIQVQLPGVADQAEAREVIGRTAQLQFRRVLEVIPPPGSPALTETATATAGPSCAEPEESRVPDPESAVLCWRTPDPESPPNEPRELPREQWNRLRLGPVELSGDDLADARAEPDQSGFGGWFVALRLTEAGAQEFAQLTSDVACAQGDQRRLAIVLDTLVVSAPPLAPEIPCGQGIPGGEATITLAGGQQEARELAVVLRSGALPLQLDFGTFQTVSPTLGRDALQAGLLAGGLGLALVAAYLILLYRGIGAAAVLELLMFGVVTVGLLIVLGATVGFTLTLAGVAGVIISIGIAADSSIIYRERYRDEVRAGRTVRSAADAAWSRAWSTNLTANTVAFLGAVVLYVLAVGPVRGFAFTLGLSTLVDMLLYLTFTRGLFGLIARSPRLAAMPAMGLRSGLLPARTAPGERQPAKAARARANPARRRRKR